ncbi:DUF2797 domain-containing protein [Promicromonospora sp. NPDC059942]|uniref:DUF2797 domain-containing protein n=1 Tax=Promicromonospora sp. NPDC059942 TaxID=3347009 RepID=UPI003646A8E0
MSNERTTPSTTPPAWRPTGLTWADGAAALEWLSPAGVTLRSALDVGARLGLRVGADRRCLGLWWDGRRVPCVAGARIDAAAKSGQCESCAAIARTRSVATDTALDDPREFRVYLAHHGSVIKAGITASARGPARLLEQGALSSLFLSAGTLVSARRCEALLTAALGLPQQVHTARKRAARWAPGTTASRAAELSAVVGKAAGLDWPPGQAWAPTSALDHTSTYGLPEGGLAPARQLDPLRPGTTVTGEVMCRIGRDVYLSAQGGATAGGAASGPATAGGVLLVDTGLLEGWDLIRADPSVPGTASASPVSAPGGAGSGVEQDALF